MTSHILALLLTISPGSVRTDTLWSQSLGTRKQLIVYLPPSYAAHPERRYPVAYYLHGLFGSEWDWVKSGGLATVMDSLVAAGRPEMIVVMPDADDSWYTTWNSLVTYQQCTRIERNPPRTEPDESYCVPWPHYDDYIARDLVAYVDGRYRTIADRAHRGIAGLSMGGYGAVTLALAYPDVFAAAASHSGVLSPLYVGSRPFAAPARYATDVDTLRGRWHGFWFSMGPAFGSDTAAWLARDPAHLARRARARGFPLPALFADVGRDDALVDENRAFRAEMRALGIPLEYAEWPGRHTWTYWRAHVGESLAWIGSRIGM